MDEQETVLGYNNDEANKIYRVCVNHGCTPDQANAIAVDIAQAYERSFEGQLKAKVRPVIIKGGIGFLTAVGIGVAGWLNSFFQWVQL